MVKVWKKYKEKKAMVDSLKKYELFEAVELCKKLSYTKFNWTLEVHIKTSADPKYNDQMIRWTVVLPHGIWKSVRVWAFVSEDKVDEAKKAWADVAWSEQLLKDIEAGKIEFDVLITTQDMMRDLAKVAKTLWPKWLMPSPKAWTIVTNLKASIEEIKKWRVEFKLDKTWNMHLWVWKINFETQKLVENIQVLLKSIEEHKPSWIKGKIFKKIVLAPTMWPGVQIVC